MRRPFSGSEPWRNAGTFYATRRRDFKIVGTNNLGGKSEWDLKTGTVWCVECATRSVSSTCGNGVKIKFREPQRKPMTEDEKDKARTAAVAGAGAGVGGAGGATVGVLELAAQGTVTGLSAGLMIGLGAAAGGALAYGVYRVFKQRKS